MESIAGGYGTSQLPLAGAILCCTSIAPEQRSALASIGQELGATIKLDLTSDVTHLIVGSTESAKYRYVAKSREDVKVLSPAWLEALRDIWMEGHDELDMAALDAEYRLPTFFGLKICLTGFDDPEQRRYIQETVDRNGAEYHGDLTKVVTHLIAATPTGKKYEHALSWRMKIVSLEWFEQSLERGMVLDEALYNPTIAVAERGRGAWERREFPSPALGKRTRDPEQSEALNPFRRKLRRSASARMGSQSQALWAGITAAGLDRTHAEGDDWTDDNTAQEDALQEVTPATFVGDVTALDMHASAEVSPAISPSQPLAVSPDDSAGDGVFQGRVILPYGFDEEKNKILRTHLESHGARIAQISDLNSFSTDDLRRGYLVVPHDAVVNLASLPERAGSMNVVTNWWAERCLFGKRRVDPTDYVLSRPFDHASISGFPGLTIHSTGFVGIELLHVTKVVTLMGATYDEQMSAKTSVIICNNSGCNEQKIKFAGSRRIPAVQPTWLWECIRSGKLQPFGGYQVSVPAPQSRISKPKRKLPSPAEVATARLSTEESFEMQQRKAQIVKKAAKQKGPARLRTLDLALLADPTPVSTTDFETYANAENNHSPLTEGELSIPGLDGQASFPLQDINANSPRRPSTSSNGSKPISRQRSSSAESLIRPTRRKSKLTRGPTPDSVIPTDTAPPVSIPQEPEPQNKPHEEKDYSDILAQLRANRKAVPTPVEQDPTRRRARRQLGRAASTRSNDSSANGSGQQLNLDDDDDRVMVQEYQPSQELGWDSPGAAKARDQMIKRLGGRVSERSVRVEGIGVVRDVASEGLGRLGRKRREKGF